MEVDAERSTKALALLLVLVVVVVVDDEDDDDEEYLLFLRLFSAFSFIALGMRPILMPSIDMPT